MLNNSLSNRTAFITGANRGLGFEISRAFIKAGAHIAITARDEQVLAEACHELQLMAEPGQKVLGFKADVTSPDDVHRAVSSALEAFGHLDILVNNAGIYGPKGAVEEVDWNEWVQAIQVNLLGSVLTCREVLPYFKAQRSGKIIQLSGGGATSPMPFISAYAASKAAIVRFAETLAREVQEFGITVNAVAPGALNTRMLDEILTAGPEKVGQTYYEKSIKQKQEGGASLENAANFVAFLASDASNGITGKLISAVWDPWEALPEHIEELKSTDIYTLRRILPKDRGMDWGDR